MTRLRVTSTVRDEPPRYCAGRCTGSRSPLAVPYIWHFAPSRGTALGVRYVTAFTSDHLAMRQTQASRAETAIFILKRPPKALGAGVRCPRHCSDSATVADGRSTPTLARRILARRLDQVRRPSSRTRSAPATHGLTPPAASAWRLRKNGDPKRGWQEARPLLQGDIAEPTCARRSATPDFRHVIAKSSPRQRRWLPRRDSASHRAGGVQRLEGGPAAPRGGHAAGSEARLVRLQPLIDAPCS
jgi:hypothetical protein